MSAINIQASLVSPSNLYQSSSAQAEAAAPAATETTTQSCAQALYGASEQLWVSMEVLGHMLLSKQTGPTLEIAYTLFANAVCNWESAYSSFTSSGGQPDAVSEAINTALNQTLPDGSSIYKLSQTVASNPADWQQLQEGVSDGTLNSLFEDVDNWIDEDGTAGSVGFQPAINSSNVNLENWISWTQGYINESPSTQNFYYNMSCCIFNLDRELNNESGPICTCLNELFNTPFFQYDGKSYSLEDIATVVQTNGSNPSNYTSTQIKEGEAALNACLPIMKMLVNMANGYMSMQGG
ncbi:MAG: hypothetical protein JSR39_02205 [Verrucomicrobia bacterium]|nr:hypothetical protein [Verrucomicrobiota bacterium]